MTTYFNGRAFKENGNAMIKTTVTTIKGPKVETGVMARRHARRQRRENRAF